MVFFFFLLFSHTVQPRFTWSEGSYECTSSSLATLGAGRRILDFGQAGDVAGLVYVSRVRFFSVNSQSLVPLPVRELGSRQFIYIYN